MGTEILTMNLRTLTGVLFLISHFSHEKRKFLVRTKGKAWIVQTKGNANSSNEKIRKMRYMPHSEHGSILKHRLLKQQYTSHSKNGLLEKHKLPQVQCMPHSEHGLMQRHGLNATIGDDYALTESGIYGMIRQRFQNREYPARYIWKESPTRLGTDDGSQEFHNMVWSDALCGGSLKRFDVTDAVACLNKCHGDDKCTVVNYSKKNTTSSGYHDCVLRQCKIPIPWPDWRPVDPFEYRGFSLFDVDFPWFNGKCAEYKKDNKKPITIHLGNELEFRDQCLEYCQIFGLTACEWNSANSNCIGTMSPIRNLRKQDNKNPKSLSEHKCIGLEMPSKECGANLLTGCPVCAEPKFGYIIKGISDRRIISTQKLPTFRNSSAYDVTSCAENCVSNQWCRYWSFEGCSYHVIGNNKCNTSLPCKLVMDWGSFKYRLKWQKQELYPPLRYDMLEIAPSEVPLAGWGDRKTCWNVGCRRFQDGFTVEGNDNDIISTVSTENDCIGICKTATINCIYYNFEDNKCIVIFTENDDLIKPEKITDRSIEYTKIECQHLCRNTEKCLQWDWREVSAENKIIGVCRMMKTLKRVHTRRHESLKGTVGTRYSCLQGEAGESEWINGQCALRNGTTYVMNNPVNFSFVGYSLTAKECKDSCITFGLTGCEWIPPVYNTDKKPSECFAVAGQLDLKFSDKKNYEKMCFPFDSRNDCAHPKYGFIITNADPIESKKVRDSWECSEFCLFTYECQHWSFAGCRNDSGLINTEKSCSTDETGKLFECKLYDKSHTDLTLNYTLNLHAGWGPSGTCKQNFVCRPFEYQSIVKGEYIMRSTKKDNKPKTKRDQCKKKCDISRDSSSESCVHFHFGLHEKRCYYVKADNSLGSSIIPLDRDVLDFPYSAEDCHDMCRKKNEKKESCLQWDWRVQTIMTGIGRNISTDLYVCLLLKQVHSVIKREDGKGESAVGTKYSCQNSQETAEAYTDDISTKIGNKITDCPDLSCCKERCIKQPYCNAVNFKQGYDKTVSECELRSAKCTDVIRPLWYDAPYMGYSLEGTWKDGDQGIWDDSDCENLDEFSDGECEDVECCKDKCRQNNKCTAINWKKEIETPDHKNATDCILRGCKCTSIVKPTTLMPPYKGWEVLHPITGGVNPLN